MNVHLCMFIFVVIAQYLLFMFQDFLNHLLKQAKKDNEVTDEKLIEYTDTMVKYISSRVYTLKFK